MGVTAEAGALPYTAEQLRLLKEHPAKFSEPILEAISKTLGKVLAPPAKVLDPFAGVGRVHQLGRLGYETLGVELEREWAELHPRTLAGDSTNLTGVLADSSWCQWAAGAGHVDAVVTSPCYGNRMADNYAGESRCPDCKGEALETACERCEGTGTITPTKRYTYRIALGRELTAGSAGGLQWGDEYRQLHVRVWRECRLVLRHGGWLLLNISDHYRGGWPQPVTLWHGTTLASMGFQLRSSEPVDTRRNRNTPAKSAKRADVEWLLAFQLDKR